MSNLAIDRFISHFERSLARDEAKRLTPPDNGDLFNYNELTEDGQREQIELQLRFYPSDKDTVFEAFGQHRLSDQWLATFLSGDTAQLGYLTDKMIREYMARTVTDRIEQER